MLAVVKVTAIFIAISDVIKIFTVIKLMERAKKRNDSRRGIVLRIIEEVTIIVIKLPCYYDS